MSTLGKIAGAGGFGLAGLLGSGSLGGIGDLAGSGAFGLAGLLLHKKKPQVPPLITGIAPGAPPAITGGLAGLFGGS